MSVSERNPCREDIPAQTEATQEECERLREENGRLRAMLGIPDLRNGAASRAEVTLEGATKSIVSASTPEEKIALFQSLLFASSNHGLAGDQCCSARGTQARRSQDTHPSPFDSRGGPKAPHREAHLRDISSPAG